MTDERNLKELVQLMRENGDTGLIFGSMVDITYGLANTIIWQGLQSGVLYEESIEGAFYLKDNILCEYATSDLYEIFSFSELRRYFELGILEDWPVLKEFFVDFPLIKLMIKNNDQVMVFIDYCKDHSGKDVRLWKGAVSGKYYYETSFFATDTVKYIGYI